MTAPMTQLISLSFFRTCILTSALHGHRNGSIFCGETNSLRFPWHRARLSGRLDSLSVPFTTKTFTSALRGSDFLPNRTPWLTAAIAIRQERLPSLLVDPACMLKLAWCKCMQEENSALAEIEGCRRCHVAATAVGNLRTVVVPMVQMLGVLFSFFVPRVVARCRDVVGSSTRRTRSGTSIDSTYERTSLCFLVS